MNTRVDGICGDSLVKCKFKSVFLTGSIKMAIWFVCWQKTYHQIPLSSMELAPCNIIHMCFQLIKGNAMYLKNYAPCCICCDQVATDLPHFYRLPNWQWSIYLCSRTSAIKSPEKHIFPTNPHICLELNQKFTGIYWFISHFIYGIANPHNIIGVDL